MPRYQQPQSGPAEIDWGNPITRGLVDVIDYSGKVPRSVILRTPHAWFGTTPQTAVAGKLGKMMDATAAYGGVYFQRGDGLYAQAVQTHIILGSWQGSPPVYGGYFATSNGDGSAESFTVQYYNTNTAFTTFPSNTAVTWNPPVPGAGLGIYEFAADAAGVNVYAGGVQVGSASGSMVTTRSTSRLVLFGERSVSGAYATKGTALLHLLYNRRISAAERKSLVANIWQIFKPATRKFFAPAGGTTLDAAAAGAAQASGDASLAAQVALAAVGIAAASGAAELSAIVPLSAVGFAVAGGATDAVATVSIAASALAESAGTGSLSVTVALTAAGSAVASGSATLSGGLPGALSAAGQAQASGQATLSATVEISAAGLAQALAAGALEVQIPLSAFGAATASGTARLVDTGGSLVLAGAPQGAGPSINAPAGTRPRALQTASRLADRGGRRR